MFRTLKGFQYAWRAVLVFNESAGLWGHQSNFLQQAEVTPCNSLRAPTDFNTEKPVNNAVKYTQELKR